jgi:hypothetical protein
MAIARKLVGWVAAGSAAVLFATGAQAGVMVVCGAADPTTQGTRTVTIDPAMAGGLCYTQTGNLQDADIAALGLSTVDKDVVGVDPQTGEGALDYTLLTSSSGTFTFDESLWDTWETLFIAFHFGGGGNTLSDNPDSFVVQLDPRDFTGTFLLGGGQLNGLSNIYLLGERCTSTVPCNPTLQVPEANSVALLALGLLALGWTTRRRKL